MSEPRILLCGPASDAAESEVSLQRLRKIRVPNVSKVVVAIGKFDTGGAATTLNIEAGYPPEPAHLQTHSAWAETSYVSDPRFRDAYDLFCLRRALERDSTFDVAVIVRDSDFDQRWPDLQATLHDQLFATWGHDGAGLATFLAFNLRDPNTSAFLDLVWEFQWSGAAYSIDPYSSEEALSTVAEALQLEAQILSG